MTRFFTADDKYFKEFLGARGETVQRLKNLYQEDYFEDKKSASQRKIMYQQEFDRINKYFDIKKGGNVLDIGCGEGNFLSLFPSNWEKYGIDISEFAIGVASRKGIITDFALEDNFFDLIIFRGTIQHIPDPISRIERCYYWLKSGGGLIFLVTPNTNSIYYKLFNTLPMLSESRNFLLPSDIMLKQILVNFGFKIKGIEYPYFGTPYASPIKDLIYFVLKLLRIRKNVKFAFYKNIMEVYAEKP